MLKVYIENDHSATKSVNNDAKSDEIPEQVISIKNSQEFLKKSTHISEFRHPRFKK